MQNKILTVTLNPAIDKSLTLEQLTFGGLNRVRGIRMDAGGKGINVAKALNGYGVNVLATGFVAGQNGKWLLDRLFEFGIPNRFVTIPGETRTNLKLVDLSKGVTTEVNEAGFVVGNEDVNVLTDILNSMMSDAKVIVFGGSIPRGVPSDIYRNLIRLAKSHGLRTILDAEGPALAEGIRAQPYVIKPNRYEMELLFGRDMSDDDNLRAASRELVSEGVELVVVSMGADGALFVSKDEEIRTWPPTVVAQSTVGAGDSMVSAIAAAALENRSVQDIAAWATAAGALTVAKPGTDMCSLSEAYNAMATVRMEIR